MERRTFLIGTGALGLGAALGPRASAQGAPEKTKVTLGVGGKPLLYYAYDLERFRDEIRGFYFELGPQAPGPFLEDVTSLAAAVRDSGTVRTEYAEEYRRFQETYCSLEDGRATDRVLELLGLGQPTA